MKLANYTMFGRYGGDTQISVSGQDSKLTMTSIASFHNESSYFPRSFNLSVTDHATVTMYCFQADPSARNFSYEERSNSITIDSTSSFYGSFLYLCARFSVTNAGLLSIDAVPGLTGVYEDGYSISPFLYVGSQTQLTNEEGATLSINTDTAGFQVQGTLENKGSIISQSGLQVFTETGALSGTGAFSLPYVQITSGAALYAGDASSSSGAMTIGGDLYLSEGAQVYSYGDGGSLTVQGDIYVQNGTTTVYGDLTLTPETSLLQVAGDATPGKLMIQGSLVTGTHLSNNGEISATDAIEIGQGGVASGTGAYTSPVIVKDGGLVLGGDAATGTGTTSFTAGLTMESGSILQTSEGNGVSVAGGTLEVAGSIANNGMVSAQSGIVVNDGGVLAGLGTYEASVVVKDGGVVLGGDAATGTGTTTFTAGLTMESGSILQTSEGSGVSVGALEVAGTIANNGTVSARSGIAVYGGGVLAGLGTYDASVSVHEGGLVLGGDAATGTGTTTFTGQVFMESGSTLQTSEGNGVNVQGGMWVSGLIVNDGTVSAPDILVNRDGVLAGFGTYASNVELDEGATLVLGSADNTMAQMKIDGDLMMRDGATIKTYVPFSPDVTGSMDVLEALPNSKVTIDMTEAPLVAGRTYTFDFGVEEDQLNLLLPDGIANAVYDTPNPDVFHLTIAAENMTPEARAGLLYRTPNGAAGSWLMEAIFGAWDPYNTAPTGDVAQTLRSMDELTVAGNGQARDSLQAAIAGASAAALGLAYSDDVQRQLRGIRNRALSEIDHPLCPNKRFSAWVQAEGNFRDVDADGSAPGYKLDSWGGTVGAVGKVTDHLQVGLALTAMYGDFDAKSSDGASGDLDISYLTAFATYKSSAWTHYFAAMGSLANAELDRTVSHTRGSYSTSGSTHGIGLAFMYELGYTVELSESASITPVFNVSYSHTLLKGYTESGAGLAMRFGDQEMDAFTLGVGLRAEAEVGKRFLNRSVSLNGRVLAKVDVGDRSSTASVTTARPLPVGSTIESNETGAFGVEVGVGLLVPLGPSGGAAFLDGALEARSDYLNWNITAGYRICF